MLKLKCPVCDKKVELADKTKINERITCPNCYAQLTFIKFKGDFILRCSLCLREDMECAVEDCEKRIAHQKQDDLL